jgi:hypothetical protein
VKRHEKMLTIPDHKGNINQNYVKFHLTPVRIRTPKTTNVGKDVGKKEPLYTAGRNVS